MTDLPPPRRPFEEGEPIPQSARPLSVDDDPTHVIVPSSPRTEVLVAVLLAAAGLLGAGFVVAYLLTDSTQLFGLTLGGALLCIAAALILAGKRVVPQEVVIEPRHPLHHDEAQRKTAELVAFGTAGMTRRRLLALCSALAGAGIAAAGGRWWARTGSRSTPTIWWSAASRPRSPRERARRRWARP